MCNHQERIDDLSFAARHAPYEMLERRGFAAHPCAARRLQLTSRGTSRIGHTRSRSTSLIRTPTLALSLSPSLFREFEQRQTSSGGATKKASSLTSAEELRRRQVEAARLPDGGKQLGSAVAAQLVAEHVDTVRCSLEGSSAMLAPVGSLPCRAQHLSSL